MSDFRIKEFVGISILVTLEIMSIFAEFVTSKIKYGIIGKVVEKIMTTSLLIAVIAAIIIMRTLKIGETVGGMINE